MSTLEQLQVENHEMRKYIEQLEKRLAESNNTKKEESEEKKEATDNKKEEARLFGCGLNIDQVERYSRQSLLKEIQAQGCRRLVNSKVTIVGAGGLGSSVALYLAAAGVGFMRIVDFDVVEKSNLHRQIIHHDARVGMYKAISAKLSCLQMNPTIQVEAVLERFNTKNCIKLIKDVDLVIDASDNVAARYIVNDACVMADKILVSGSAMRWEGQLTVYNFPLPEEEGAKEGDKKKAPKKGPCYRCMFPKPPPAASVGSCSDSGVVGVVPGTIGCLQALEAQKILMGNVGDCLVGRMLLFNGLASSYRVIKMRPAQCNCVACGVEPQIMRAGTDGIAICEKNAPKSNSDGGLYGEYLPPSCALIVNDLSLENRMTVQDYSKKQQEGKLLLLDVRTTPQYGLCHLEPSVNLPWETIQECGKSGGDMTSLIKNAVTSSSSSNSSLQNIGVLCRRGQNSVLATKLLLEQQKKGTVPADWQFKNIDGGLAKWSSEVDESFPLY